MDQAVGGELEERWEQETEKKRNIHAFNIQYTHIVCSMCSSYFRQFLDMQIQNKQLTRQAPALMTFSFQWEEMNNKQTVYNKTMVDSDMVRRR